MKQCLLDLRTDIYLMYIYIYIICIQVRNNLQFSAFGSYVIYCFVNNVHVSISSTSVC